MDFNIEGHVHFYIVEPRGIIISCNVLDAPGFPNSDGFNKITAAFHLAVCLLF